MISSSEIDYSNSTRPTGNCWSRFRESNGVIMVVTFLALMTGVMVVSVLQPILPDLLDVIYRESYLPDDNSTANTQNATFSNKPIIIGSLLGFAPLIEIFFTPLAVCSVNHVGFKKTMIFSAVLQIGGCYAIAYANRLFFLYAARLTQALSVILSTVASFSMIAVRFRDEEKRSRALGASMHSFPIGILLAYPAGTAIYHYFGLAMPFVAISVISAVGTILLLFSTETPLDHEYLLQESPDAGGTSYGKILSNKSVLLGLMLLSYAWSVIFMLGATTPNRMASLLHATSWQIGLVLFVSTLIQVATSAVVDTFAVHLNRWYITFVGNLLSICGLVAYPWCSSIYHTIGPESCVRIGWGFVNASMGPLMGILMDGSPRDAVTRVYALFMSFCLFGAFAGSLLGGWLDGFIGFDLLFWSCSVLTFVVAILGLILSYCLPEESDEVGLDDSSQVDKFTPLFRKSRSPSPKSPRSLSLSYGYS